MVLQLHRAERADTIVAALAELLTDPLADPFATEFVCVPTPGVERWLSQSLSLKLGAAGHEDGVCIGVEFPSPSRLIRQVSADVLPDEPAEDPWAPARAVWPLLQIIDASRGEAWSRPVWAYLGDRGGNVDTVRAGRRWSTARRIAELFARYATIRPTMLAHWRVGRDADADGRPLPADRHWQAELWRRLRAEIGGLDPLHQLTALTDGLRERPQSSRLPERISIFGPTRLDPRQLEVFTALAEHREVHLWLPHPSPAIWARIDTEIADPAALTVRPAEAADRLAEHRLLGYLGRDSRELQLNLISRAGSFVDHHHASPAAAPTTVLAQLQSDIAANRRLGEPDRPLLDPTDRSIAFHASHGPDRQVEVLRELLVGLLADDPTLEPRDIVVMCPDIERYAPLISATFGLDTAESEAEHPGHRLRVRLADRSLRELNPLLAVVSRLVGMADSRLSASELLDLCAVPAVSRRFGFRTEDLERLHELVPAAGVRWGLDRAHRERYGMGGFGQNTWAAGLERLLLGVAMDETEQRFIGTTLPLDDVDSGAAGLVGRLAECVVRVEAVLRACRDRRPAGAWMELFSTALADLTSVPPSEGWQLSHAYATLRRLAADAEADPADTPVELSLAEVSALLAEAFRGRPTRANFRTGTLTMCTMVPMRSVPHRVVCLLGLDDGVFPRPVRPDGDDLTAEPEWVGDRDPRSEDRQLLLDAVLSAREKLLIIYAGMDPRTGAKVAPAVPVDEVRQAVAQTVRAADGDVLAALTTEHPLQPFDPRNFTAERPGSPSFSFDRAALRGVRAATGPRAEAPATVARLQLPPLGPDWQPTLGDLTRFLGHPIRALLRDRAQLTSWREDEEPDEQIPIDLDGLQTWQIGERMLRAHLQGQPIDALVAAEWRRGSLPPQAFGRKVIEQVGQKVVDVAASATPFRGAPPDRREIALDLGGTRFTGNVDGLYGVDLLRVSYSRLSAKARLLGWVELLALTAAHPGQPWRAVVVGTGGRSVLGPVSEGFAALVLADLIDLQRTGLCEPLPFAVRTSAEYAEVRRADRTIDSAREQLQRSWDFDRDELYEQYFGAEASLDDLMRQPSIPAEERGSLAEPSRFGTLARRVFHPLLDCEVFG